MKKTLILAIILSLLNGCSAINKLAIKAEDAKNRIENPSIGINETMSSWLGFHQSALISQWGPPQETSSNGSGGSVLIYKSFLSQTEGHVRYSSSDGKIYYTDPIHYIRTRMFYVNSLGIIYQYKWQGI
jgi:hypothetical protein